MINFYLAHSRICQYFSFVNVNPLTLTDNLRNNALTKKISFVIKGLTINTLMPITAERYNVGLQAYQN